MATTMRAPLRAEATAVCAFSDAQEYAEAFFRRAARAIVLAWSARCPLLPDFRGTLRLRIAAPAVRLILEGGYVPPFGPLGAAFDALVGRRIAESSLRDLAERIAHDLEQREAACRG